MNEHDPKPPLDYRNYADDRPRRRTSLVSFVKGLIRGIIWVVIIGFVDGYFAIASVSHISKRPTQISNISAYCFAFTAIAAAVGAFVVLRAQRRRFYMVGLLLGVSVTCSIEGICFHVG